MVSYFCMYFKGGTPTTADGKRKERKVIEKLGNEVFTDNVSVSIFSHLLLSFRQRSVRKRPIVSSQTSYIIEKFTA